MVSGLDKSPLILVQVRFCQQLCPAQHPVHRCAYFVAHGGQELTLRPCCRLRIFLGPAQIPFHSQSAQCTGKYIGYGLQEFLCLRVKRAAVIYVQDNNGTT